ncbi:MAG: putative ribonuclease H [uncultured marine phage]|uniref:Putative ribonuclease H n=1 Tax=uncultured marine phage TaxID=707152 RepID=A0A8D9C9P6_9VIRU|nr:MAG: putative ribonuclease H [uncultured marine phage]
MENTIDIYTDASHYFGNNVKKHIFGYSGIILDDDRDYILKGTISRKTIKDYFDLKCGDSTLNIEHGEMIAIAKSLWQFRKDSHNIRIFSDCLNALNKIETILGGGSLKKKVIKRKFNKLLFFITNLINKIKSNGGSVELFWVKGHADCYGNEIADKAAKDMFIPEVEISKMTKNQRKKFNKLGKKQHTYRNQLISNQVREQILGLDDKFFFDKETNEFSEYKMSLISKETEIKPNLSALETYTETLRMSIQKEVDRYKSFFKNLWK